MGVQSFHPEGISDQLQCIEDFFRQERVPSGIGVQGIALHLRVRKDVGDLVLNQRNLLRIGHFLVEISRREISKNCTRNTRFRCCGKWALNDKESSPAPRSGVSWSDLLGTRCILFLQNYQSNSTEYGYGRQYQA